MLNSVLNDIRNKRKSIEKNRAEQQERLRKFDKKYAQTIKTIEKRNSEFEIMKDEVNKELSRHF